MIDSKEGIFLQEKFREYYLKNSVTAPERIEKREFGIGRFGKKIVLRHLSFVSEKNLNDYLQKYAPLFISYSLASYKFPDRQPMDKKDFIQADMVFEFDADMIETSCKEKHDSWKCGKCSAGGKGNVKKCADCGEFVAVEEWFCSECIGVTQKETLKLVKVLQDDLGFESNDLKVNFSGNAGFHVHLQSPSIQFLTKDQRIQLVDYLSLHNMNPESMGFVLNEKDLRAPAGSLLGIQARLINDLKSVIDSNDSDLLIKCAENNISHKKALDFLSEKNHVLNSLEKGVLRPVYASDKKKDLRFWTSLINSSVSRIRLDIDRQTSIDLKKIIRLPDSLHGSTALKTMTVSLSDLKSFDAFNDAVVFSRNKTIKVFINKAPKIILSGQEFGPFSSQEESLPEFAALYLIAKQKAVLR